MKLKPKYSDFLKTDRNYVGVIKCECPETNWHPSKGVFLPCIAVFLETTPLIKIVIRIRVD